MSKLFFSSPGMKVCPGCAVEKPVTEEFFYKKLSSKHGFCGYCKPCMGKMTTSWIKRNSEKHKATRLARDSKEENREKSYFNTLRNNYGITAEQYERMYVEQNGTCFICEKPPRYRKHLSVDHDHTSNKIRRLLCEDCNIALGVCHEDVNILEKMIRYLKTFQD